MIKIQTTALIRSISDVMEIVSRTSGQVFYKQEVVLDDSWTKDGSTYPNYVAVEFSGDKLTQIEGLTPGQRVTVEAYVTGREHQGRIFNTIKGLSIAPYQVQQPANMAQQPPAPPAYSQQSYRQPPAYQQPAYPHQPAYPGSVPFGQPPAPMPGGNLGPENLPFR